MRNTLTFSTNFDVVADVSGVHDVPSGIYGNEPGAVALLYRNAEMQRHPTDAEQATVRAAAKRGEAELEYALNAMFMPVGRAGEGGWL